MADETSLDDDKMDFETELNKQLGQFDKYQLINVLLIAVPAIVSGFMAGDYIFTAAQLPYRCAVPECDGLQPEYAPDWILNAIPTATAGKFQDCRRYELYNVSADHFVDACPAVLFNRNSTVPCDGYVYERTNSVVFDFGLECREWLRALAGTLNSLGGMVALPLAGYVSDYFGRRTSIVLFSFNIALVGFVRSFSVNYAMYVTLQFMQTAIGGGAYSAAYILAMEIVGPKFRVATSATMSSMFAFGQVLLGLIASVVTPWRTLSMVLFAPVFLLVSYRWILTESHRWLLSKNKQKEAKATLERAAHLNGRKIPEKSMNFLLTAISNKSNIRTDVDGKEKSLFYRIINSPVLLRRCCTTPVWWVTTTFVYYGLSINSVSLSGNMYYNYVSIAAVEIPGYWTAVLMLDKIGRKTVLFSGYMLCAICCISFAFIPTTYPTLSMLVYLVGKFSIAIVFTTVYLFTSELYPTRHRHSLLGFSSMIGRVGSVVAPLTPPLMVYWRGIPSMMFGAMAMLSALLVLTQPETLGVKLPDTFEDAEQIGRSQL